MSVDRGVDADVTPRSQHRRYRWQELVDQPHHLNPRSLQHPLCHPFPIWLQLLQWRRRVFFSDHGHARTNEGWCITALFAGSHQEAIVTA